MQTVGQIIRQQREAKGLTLAALAAQVGATKGYLSMIENHRLSNPPSRSLLVALESALDLEAGQLRKSAGWQSTSPEVKAEIQRLAEDARKGRELATWLRESTSRRAGGGKNLDKLYRSGQLRKRLAQAFGDDSPQPAELTPMQGKVPLINKVAAGYPSDFTDLDYPARIADEYVPSPDLHDPDAFAARVCGQSMMPEYREGDVVVFSPLADIVDGCDCFVRLEPDHQTTFKRIFIDEANQAIRLQPLNPSFPPTILPREQVAGMYRAVWRMSRL